MNQISLGSVSRLIPDFDELLHHAKQIPDNVSLPVQCWPSFRQILRSADVTHRNVAYRIIPFYAVGAQIIQFSNEECLQNHRLFPGNGLNFRYHSPIHFWFARLLPGFRVPDPNKGFPDAS